MIEVLENKSSNLKKFFLLALSFYLILYCFLFPLSYIPNSIETLEWIYQPVDWFTHWFGKSILGIRDLKSVSQYEYGDSIFEYVKLISMPVLCLLLSTIVFAFTFRKTGHQNFYKWTIVYIRYNIAANLFAQGCSMLFSLDNYDSLNLHALETPLGDYYGISLFWAFMGYSKGYLIFCGITQVFIAVLLFFRRTTTLGGFLAIVFYINLLVYNIAFGFPAKLYLMHKLLFLFILLGPNIKALFRFFVNGKATTLNPYEIHIAMKEMRIMRIIVKYSFLTLLLVHELTRLANKTQENYPLSGSYQNFEFITNGDTVKFDQYGYKWDKLIIDKGYASIVSNISNSSYQLKISVDTLNHKFDLHTNFDSTKRSTFEYVEKASKRYTTLKISGIYFKDTIQARFSKKSLDDYILMNYKAPWINR